MKPTDRVETIRFSDKPHFQARIVHALLADGMKTALDVAAELAGDEFRYTKRIGPASEEAIRAAMADYPTDSPPEGDVVGLRECLRAMAVGACAGYDFDDGSEEDSAGLLMTMGPKEWLRWVAAIERTFCDKDAGRELPAQGKVFPHVFWIPNLERFAESLDEAAEVLHKEGARVPARRKA